MSETFYEQTLEGILTTKVWNTASEFWNICYKFLKIVALFVNLSVWSQSTQGLFTNEKSTISLQKRQNVWKMHQSLKICKKPR